MFGKLTAIIAATMITITPISASSAYAPALPYIPPTEVQLFDLIYNAYGVTAPTDSADDDVRLAGYLDLYSRVLGASNEQFMEDIKTMFTQAKTGRTLEISSTLSSQLMQGMKEALANGITLPTEEEPIKDYTGIYNALHSQFSAPDGVTMQYITQVANNNGAADGNARCIVLWWPASFCQFTIIPYDKQYVYEPTKFTIQNWSGYVSWGTWNVSSNYLWQPQGYANPLTYGGGNELHDLGMVAAQVVTVSAQSTDIKNKIDAIALHPLTKYTKIENGVVDTTEPIRIDLPITMPYPANVVTDLPAVQDDLGTIPISDNPAQTVADMQATAAADLGTTQEYALNLTELFPFCIPFDIARVIGLFVAEPQTPVFEFAFPVGYKNGALVMQTFEMDLTALDGVAVWVRRGLLAVFVVGLGMVTRQVFLRG